LRRQRPEELAQGLESVTLLDLLHARQVRLTADRLGAGQRAKEITIDSENSLSLEGNTEAELRNSLLASIRQ
jgi:hypothetical protein